jgi:hypothetical protein
VALTRVVERHLPALASLGNEQTTAQNKTKTSRTRICNTNKNFQQKSMFEFGLQPCADKGVEDIHSQCVVKVLRPLWSRFSNKVMETLCSSVCQQESAVVLKSKPCGVNPAKQADSTNASYCFETKHALV